MILVTSDEFEEKVANRYEKKCEKKYGYRYIEIDNPNPDDIYTHDGFLYVDPNSKKMFYLPFCVLLVNDHIIGRHVLKKNDFDRIAKTINKYEKRERFIQTGVDDLLQKTNRLPKPVRWLIKSIFHIIMYLFLIPIKLRLWYEDKYGTVD